MSFLIVFNVVFEFDWELGVSEGCLEEVILELGFEE